MEKLERYELEIMIMVLDEKIESIENTEPMLDEPKYQKIIVINSLKNIIYKLETNKDPLK